MFSNIQTAVEKEVNTSKMKQNKKRKGKIARFKNA